MVVDALGVGAALGRESLLEEGSHCNISRASVSSPDDILYFTAL